MVNLRIVHLLTHKIDPSTKSFVNLLDITAVILHRDPQLGSRWEMRVSSLEQGFAHVPGTHVGRHGSTMVCTAASQLQGPGLDSRLGLLSVWSLHILLVSAWVSSGCSGFLPQSKDVRVGLIGHAKLPLSVRGISRVTMIEPGWDCGRCRLDGPNGLLLHCRVSMISMIYTLQRFKGAARYHLFKGNIDGQ